MINKNINPFSFESSAMKNESDAKRMAIGFLFSFATSCSIAEEIHTKKRVDSSILIVDDVYAAAHICFMSGQKFRGIREE